MSEYIAFEDCVAKYDGDKRYPTAWQAYPLDLTDPLRNAALFDAPQRQEFSVDGWPIFDVIGDWASRDVRLRAYHSDAGLMLTIQDRRGKQSIWLEPTTFKAFRDYLNTTK